jgi:hypothetical protein
MYAKRKLREKWVKKEKHTFVAQGCTANNSLPCVAHEKRCSHAELFGQAIFAGYKNKWREIFTLE